MDPERLAPFLRLVVITDVALATERGGVAAVVEAALEQGARCIQLRMKRAGAREMLQAARPLRSMTRAAGALLVVNDRLDVALAAGADGVHLGPDDLPVAAARRAAGDDFLIGRSADEPAAARAAVENGADYLGCGAVFSTSSKADAGEVIGVEGLARVVRAVTVPVVGIGGITPSRIGPVARTGAAGAAVISSVMGADDPAEAVRKLLEAFGRPGR